VAVIEDPPNVAAPAPAQGGGVPGSVGPGTGTGSSPFGTVRITPPPEPQPATEKPAPKPKPIQRITVGGVVQQGKLISGPSPIYPALAKQARVSGVVRLQAVIARNGSIMDLHAVTGNPLLIPAALAAVRLWVFQPTYLNGEPVEVATDIEVKFLLQ
jgi:protein TonB